MENFDELLKKANEGDPNAQCEIGIYFSKKGDFDKSIEWHKKAAEQGYENSIYFLGWIYKYNKINKKEAIKWFQILAKKEDKYAQYKLGELYLEEKNYEEAKKWFQRATEHQHEMAQHYFTIVNIVDQIKKIFKTE